MSYKLLVVNSYFKKKEDHFVTFKSGFINTQIDYFLMRADSRRFCQDCKVIPSEYLGTQHRFLVLDVEFKCSKWKKRSVGNPRVCLLYTSPSPRDGLLSRMPSSA